MLLEKCAECRVSLLPPVDPREGRTLEAKHRRETTQLIVPPRQSREGSWVQTSKPNATGLTGVEPTMFDNSCNPSCFRGKCWRFITFDLFVGRRVRGPSQHQIGHACESQRDKSVRFGPRKAQNVRTSIDGGRPDLASFSPTDRRCARRDDVDSVERCTFAESAIGRERSLRGSIHESPTSISQFIGRAWRRYRGLPERAQECRSCL